MNSRKNKYWLISASNEIQSCIHVEDTRNSAASTDLPAGQWEAEDGHGEDEVDEDEVDEGEPAVAEDRVAHALGHADGDAPHEGHGEPQQDARDVEEQVRQRHLQDTKHTTRSLMMMMMMMMMMMTTMIIL